MVDDEAEDGSWKVLVPYALMFAAAAAGAVVEGPGHGWGAGNPQAGSTDERTVALDVVDPRTDRLVWRSVAGCSFSARTSEAEQVEAAADVAAALLTGFPPEAPAGRSRE